MVHYFGTLIVNILTNKLNNICYLIINMLVLIFSFDVQKNISYASQIYIDISKILKQKNQNDILLSGLTTVFLILRYFYHIRFIISYPHYIWVTEYLGSTTSLTRILKLNENIVPDWNNNNITDFKYYRYLIIDINLFNIWLYGQQKNICAS